MSQFGWWANHWFHILQQLDLSLLLLEDRNWLKKEKRTFFLFLADVGFTSSDGPFEGFFKMEVEEELEVLLRVELLREYVESLSLVESES